MRLRGWTGVSFADPDFASRASFNTVFPVATGAATELLSMTALVRRDRP